MNLTRYTNPRLTGVVVKEAVKCGKQTCHCSKGYKHRWYYYLYYRKFENEKWRLKKEYIRQIEVKYLREKIKVLKKKDILMKDRSSANVSLLKDTQAYLNGNMSAKDLLKSIYEIT